MSDDRTKKLLKALYDRMLKLDIHLSRIQNLLLAHDLPSTPLSRESSDFMLYMEEFKSLSKIFLETMEVIRRHEEPKGELPDFETDELYYMLKNLSSEQRDSLRLGVKMKATH